MDTKVTEKINKLKSDRVHGAGWLSRQAIGILNLALDRSQANTIAEFIEETQNIASELIKARPAITPIANYTSQFLRQIIERSQSEKELASLKSFAKSKGNELINHR